MHIDLKFLKSWGAYNAGEIARFVHAQAQALIERGVAIEHAATKALEQIVADKDDIVTDASKTNKAKAAQT